MPAEGQERSEMSGVSDEQGSVINRDRDRSVFVLVVHVQPVI